MESIFLPEKLIPYFTIFYMFTVDRSMQIFNLLKIRTLNNLSIIPHAFSNSKHALNCSVFNYFKSRKFSGVYIPFVKRKSRLINTTVA